MKAKIKNLSKGRIHVFLGRIRTIQPGEEIETPVQNMFIRPIMGLIAVGVAQVTVTCKRAEAILFERHLRGAPAHIKSRLRFNFEDEKQEETAEQPAEEVKAVEPAEGTESPEAEESKPADQVEASSEKEEKQIEESKTGESETEDIPDELIDLAEEDLQKKTKKELIKIAEKLGITIHGKTKAELIEDILKHVS